MRAWPVARSIFDAPYVREANERTTSWIMIEYGIFGEGSQISTNQKRASTKSHASGKIKIVIFVF